jgi:hypothetical protein
MRLRRLLSQFHSSTICNWRDPVLVVDKLIEHGLRDRIRVICSGKMIKPAGVAAALCIGADCVNSARGFIFALRCLQALQCNTNTCPSGITTHDADLQQGLNPGAMEPVVKCYGLELDRCIHFSLSHNDLTYTFTNDAPIYQTVLAVCQAAVHRLGLNDFFEWRRCAGAGRQVCRYS